MNLKYHYQYQHLGRKIRKFNHKIELKINKIFINEKRNKKIIIVILKQIVILLFIKYLLNYKNLQ